MKLLARYLWGLRKTLLAFGLFAAVFALSFFLYGLPAAAVLYPFLLCAGMGLAFLAAGYARCRRRHRAMERLLGLPPAALPGLPRAEGVESADYQALIGLMQRERADAEAAMDSRYRDMVEYYTVWAHQIKTPIAAMRLSLQNEDTPLARRLSPELTRIEQYAEMVLAFLRLGSDATDYVFRECELDGILQKAVRRFAGEFIGRKIGLDYQPVRTRVVTDEKWLTFVVEQLLSNALKYTQEGSIRLYVEEGPVLCVADTGMGIAPEDLPRIFEKGYTGFHGRAQQAATGIGLYLCRSVCRRLGHTLSASSQPDRGTVMRIGLAQRRTPIE